MPGYSPLFGTNYAPTINRNGLTRAFFRLARRQPRISELLDELIGAAAGATALVARKRVTASAIENGGVRPIETVNMINRATTAADRTTLRAMLNTDSKITTPTNGAGVNWKA